MQNNIIKIIILISQWFIGVKCLNKPLNNTKTKGAVTGTQKSDVSPNSEAVASIVTQVFT